MTALSNLFIRPQPSTQSPYFIMYKTVAGLFAASRTIIKTLEWSYSRASYDAKLESAQKSHFANFVNIPKENTTFFGEAYNTVTSLNTIRALSLIKNAGDYCYGSPEFAIGAVGLHITGIALDYVKPEEYCGKVGIAIHYLPEFVGIPLTAATLQVQKFAATGKLDQQHIAEILKFLIPSAGITVAFFGNKFAQHDYNSMFSEHLDANNNTIVLGEDSEIHSEL